MARTLPLNRIHMRVSPLVILILATSVSAQSQIRPGSELVDGRHITSSVATYSVRTLRPVQENVGTFSEQLIVDVEAETVTRTAFLIVPMANRMQSDSLVAAWPSLAPVSHQSDDTDRQFALSFDGAHVVGSGQLKNGSGTREVDISSDGAFFDEGWTAHLLRALPLAEGFNADIATYDPESSTVRTMEIAVLESVQVDLRGSTTTAWLVQRESGGRVTTYTIDAASRMLLRMEFEPDPGVVVEFALQ